MCYKAKFGSSVTRGVRIERNPKNWEHWNPAPFGWGVTDSLKQAPTYVTMSDLVVLRQKICINRMKPQTGETGELPLAVMIWLIHSKYASPHLLSC